MDDPWGEAEPPAVTDVPPLPPRLARLTEVQALAADGWRALDDAPLYCLLPAAWPLARRTWVPDRLPRVGMAGTDRHSSSFVALSDEDDESWADDIVAEEAAAASLPAPPPGRLWLVRSPWPRLPVSAVCALVWAQVEQRRGDDVAAMYRAAVEAFAWNEDTALAVCPTELRTLLDEWAVVGRTGEDVSAFVELHLRPATFDRFLRDTGLDETRALAWLRSLGTGADDDTIAFVAGWRAAGLPGDPPPGADRFRHREPAELRRWLDACFELDEAAMLGGVGLDVALRWREAGFDARETAELLEDDPELTSAEARAFDGTPVREARRGWIYFGFSAAEATAWHAVGFTPSVARVWRAVGRSPAHVLRGQRYPPELTVGRTGFSFRVVHDHVYGEMETTWDEVPDPPGTRGRRARRSGD